MSMIAQIDHNLTVTRIQERQLKDKIAELENKLASVSAKAETWQEALEMAKKEEAEKSQPKTRKRTASSDWKNVFEILMRKHPKPFGYIDISQAAEKLGIDIQETSMRSKMSKYTKDGYVRRLSDGEFNVSSKGQIFFDLLKTTKPPAKAEGLKNEGEGWNQSGLPTSKPAGSIPVSSTPNFGGGSPPSISLPGMMPGIK